MLVEQQSERRRRRRRRRRRKNNKRFEYILLKIHQHAMPPLRSVLPRKACHLKTRHFCYWCCWGVDERFQSGKEKNPKVKTGEAVQRWWVSI